MKKLATEAEQAFVHQFSRPSSFGAAAPGRVNLIGEHVDYNDGLVLPMAIERYTLVMGAVADDKERNVATIFSTNLQQSISIPLDDATPDEQVGWGSYLKGVFVEFRERGLLIPPFDAVVTSNIPIGGGLSSSAALEVATATFLERLIGSKLDPMEKVLLCQSAEQRFAQVPCGIMDQCCSVFGQADKLMLIDCKSNEIQFVDFDSENVAIVIANSNVRHGLADGHYAARRNQCDAALKHLGRSSWREVTLDDLKQQNGLPETELRRARHVVGEISRTKEAVESIRARDWNRVGLLMNESHESLRHDFEVSCDELDMLVELSHEIDAAGAVYGSRMTGGGFGGCTVSLVRPRDTESIMKTLRTRYFAETGIEPNIFASRPARGAQVLDFGTS